MNRISGSLEKVQGIEKITGEQISAMLKHFSDINDPVIEKTTKILADSILKRRSQGEEILSSNNIDEKTCSDTAKICLALYVLQYQPAPIKVVYVGPTDPSVEYVWETILNGTPIRDTAAGFADRVLKHYQESFKVSEQIRSVISAYILSPTLIN